MIDTDLVRRATAGDREALESLIEGTQDKVYGLALRMLWHPEDARDATQEILLRVVTHLSSFRHESSFPTWVYRLATNALLNFRKSRLEREAYDFERFGRELDQGLSENPSIEKELLIEEIKIGCTLGMLTCLDRNHRLAYIIGEILEFDSSQAAEILEISPSSFRQRLSRARKAVIEFTRRKCGIVNSRQPLPLRTPRFNSAGNGPGGCVATIVRNTSQPYAAGSGGDSEVRGDATDRGHLSLPSRVPFARRLPKADSRVNRLTTNFRGGSCAPPRLLRMRAQQSLLNGRVP